MNGMDFDQRVLRPWARDPSFYVTVWPHRTDVPSREAPVAEPETHLFAYKYPLSAADQKTLLTEIGAIPGFLAQGKVNLKDANARDLWRSEEHTSELQSLMRISYAVFCLKKQNNYKTIVLHDN